MATGDSLIRKMKGRTPSAGTYLTALCLVGSTRSLVGHTQPSRRRITCGAQSRAARACLRDFTRSFRERLVVVDAVLAAALFSFENAKSSRTGKNGSKRYNTTRHETRNSAVAVCPESGGRWRV